MSAKKAFFRSILISLLLATAVQYGILVVYSIDTNPSEWSRTYGGYEYDRAYDIIRTADDGFAITGCIRSSGDEQGDAWLIKTDKMGEIEWEREFGGNRWDEADALIQTNDGGYAIIGHSYERNDPSDLRQTNDILFIKTDANGNQEWMKYYGGDDYDQSRSILQLSDGGFVILGSTYSFGEGEKDVLLIRTDEDGNQIWYKTYGGSDSEHAGGIVVTSDGGFVIVGSSMSFGYESLDMWLIKTDNLGNVEWNQTYGGSEIDYGDAIISTTDGGYAVAGSTESFGNGEYDTWLVKIDKVGNLEWSKTYGGTGIDTGRSLLQTVNSEYVLTGETFSYNDQRWGDFILIKTSSNGDLMWTVTYGGTDEEEARSVVETSDGGFAIVGSTRSFGAGGSDCWLIKVNSQGIPEFPTRIILPLVLAITSIVLIYRQKLQK